MMYSPQSPPVQSLEPGLTEIVTEPKFAIGQRALLVEAPGGNVLWDCVSLIDDATIAAVEALGDAVSPDYSSHIARAKDVAAGAVLIAAVGAVVIGGLVFVPRLLRMAELVP